MTKAQVEQCLQGQEFEDVSADHHHNEFQFVRGFSAGYHLVVWQSRGDLTRLQIDGGDEFFEVVKTHNPDILTAAVLFAKDFLLRLADLQMTEAEHEAR